MVHRASLQLNLYLGPIETCILTNVLPSVQEGQPEGQGEQLCGIALRVCEWLLGKIHCICKGCLES